MRSDTSLLIQVTTSRHGGRKPNIRREVGVELGFITSSDRKAAMFKPCFAEYGVSVIRVLADDDLDEVESVSPRKVLPSKLEFFSQETQSLLLWLREHLEIFPQAVMTADVLGLKIERPKQSFGNASGVNKKPEGDDPIAAAAWHFAKLRQQPIVDGYHWEELVAGAASAPIDRQTGRVLRNQIRPRWEQPMDFGWSPGLVAVLADQDSVRQLVRCGLMSYETFTCGSISGIRRERLMKDIVALAVAQPNDGLSAKVLFGKQEWTLDQQSDLLLMGGMLDLVDKVTANTSPGLVAQVAKDVITFGR